MFAMPAFRNFINFLVNRPPAVVCLLCLIVFTFATFSFTYYVQNAGLLINSDAKYDWIKLLKHFNDLNYCLTDNKTALNSQDLFVSEKLVYVNISLDDFKLFQNYSTVKIVLSLENWHTTCPKLTKKVDQLEMYFNVPKKETWICGIIRGPDEFLPTFSKKLCNFTNIEEYSDKKKDVLVLTNYTKSSLFCPNGSKTTLNIKGNDLQDFAVYLNEEDEATIVLHVFWAGCIFTSVVVAVLLYGFTRSHKNIDHNYT